LLFFAKLTIKIIFIVTSLIKSQFADNFCRVHYCSCWLTYVMGPICAKCSLLI